MKILSVLWTIAERIFKPNVSFTSKGSNSASREMPRRRPLYTCVASFLAMIHIGCRKLEDFNGPIGSITKKITICMRYAMPILYTMQFQWLSVLSFVDNCILTSEIVVEKLFPPSSRLFDKIDELAYVVESLPGKFDESVEKLAMIIHQVPFLDWALVQLIAWLNFWISCLTHWGSKNTGEKEIMIDVNHNDHYFEQESTKKEDFPDTLLEEIMENGKSEGKVDEKKVLELESRLFEEATSPASSSTCDPFEDAVSSPIYDSYEDVSKGVGDGMTKSDFGKCSYKEMLEKGAKENEEKKEESMSTIVW